MLDGFNAAVVVMEGEEAGKEDHVASSEMIYPQNIFSSLRVNRQVPSSSIATAFKLSATRDKLM